MFELMKGHMLAVVFTISVCTAGSGIPSKVNDKHFEIAVYSLQVCSALIDMQWGKHISV